MLSIDSTKRPTVDSIRKIISHEYGYLLHKIQDSSPTTPIGSVSSSKRNSGNSESLSIGMSRSSFTLRNHSFTLHGALQQKDNEISALKAQVQYLQNQLNEIKM